MSSRSGENKLTDTGLKRVRLFDGKALALDGGGLRAIVIETRSGRVARFTYRFRLGDVRADMRLGSWPEKSLAELRELSDRARDLVRRGADPREAARDAKAQGARERAAAEARLTVRGLFEKWDRLHLRRAYKDGGAEPRLTSTRTSSRCSGTCPQKSSAELTWPRWLTAPWNGTRPGWRHCCSSTSAR